MADLLAELDPTLFVIDCLPNMEAALVAERTPPLVKRLRQNPPRIPILLVEDRTYADSLFVVSRQQRNESSRRAFQQAYAALKDEGVTGLHYMEGATLLGADRDDTVDGSHPTDLGFRRQADRFVEKIGPILNG